MSKDQVSNKSILDEHGRIVSARHVLALVNFVAILAGTVITLFFISKRGCPQSVATHLWILLVINIIQAAICVVDLVTKKALGIYLNWLPFVSYGVGGLWLLTLVGEMAAGAAELGALRTDLIAIAIVQFIVALIAYLVWPMLDRKAIDAMIRPSVRGDGKRRKARSKTYVIGYVVVCMAVVVLQGAALLAYKLPPRPYDLFASSRAVKYELTEDGSGYIVTEVYRGTSPELNIPATFNDLPVVGIKSGALVEDGLLDKYKVSDITFGTPVKADDGSYVYESNLEYIESGAISNDKITELTLPASVTRVGENAVKSKSLKTLEYKAAADFSIKSFDCAALNEIVMEGESVGNIVSLDGMSHDVTIRVEKDIYNKFRQNNMDYIHSFVPMADEDEFCVDFYTDSDYYIESIFEKKGNAVTLSYTDLKNNKISGVSPVTDTLAYIRDNHELDTDGVKKDSAFRGWYYNDAFTEECVFTENAQVRFTENTTLYAKWIDEYTGTFDWGTFKPTNAVTELHWTSEDVVQFPEVTDRVGYADGVKWTAPGSSAYITDSSSLNRSVTVHGTWILDKPQIDIIPNKENKSGFTISQSKNEISFTYDESRTLSLEASYSHTLNGTIYSFSWSKDNRSLNNTTESAYASLVADGGVYTLDVTAISPYGETSAASTSVTVDVARKPLGISSYLTMADKTVEYSNSVQSVQVDGTLPANNKIKVSYEYKDADGKVVSNSGVRNAGEYTVTAYYEKDNAADQANYAKESLQASFVVTPKVLNVSGWTKTWVGDSFTTVYNGRSQSLTATLGGVLSGDSVQIRHSENVKTAAGNYMAEAAEIYGADAHNYSFTAVSQPWNIDKKVITVSGWNKDNAFTGNTVVYDGAAHGVYATLEGAENGEALTFNYANNGANVTSATTAGTYSANIIGISGTTAGNYIFDTSSKDARYEWIISPRTLAISYSTVGDAVYDGTSNHGVIATVQNIVAGDLSKFNEQFFDVVKNSEVIQSGSAGYGNYSIAFNARNAGTYNIAVSLKGEAHDALLKNYTASIASKQYTISPKPVTVRKDGNKAYNGKEQSLCVYIDGIVDNDVTYNQFTTSASSGSLNGNTFVLEHKGTDVGEYPVSVTNFGNTNYSLTAYDDAINITRKALSAQWWIDGTITSQRVVYDGKPHTIMAVASGTVNNDTVEFTYTGTTVATNVKVESGAVTSYAVTASLDQNKYPNYTFVSQTRNWTIDQYTVNFTWEIGSIQYTGTAERSFIYTGEPYTVTPIFTTCDDNVSIDYASNSTLSATDVLNYYITVNGFTGTTASNYKLGANTQFKWRIDPKPITVTWGEAGSYIYNGANQGPTFTLNGLTTVKSGATVTLNTESTVNGVKKTNNNLQVQLTSGDRYSLVNVDFAKEYGIYSVKVASISDRNYEIESKSNLNMSFTIEQKTLALTGEWRYANGSENGVYTTGIELVYNKSAYVFTTSILESSLCDGDKITLLYDSSFTGAGAYTARVSGLSGTGNYNYKLPTANTTLSLRIYPKSVTLTWGDAEKTYSGKAQTISVTGATGLCTGDTVTALSLTYANQSGTDAGDYTTTATCGSANYTLTNRTCTWTINKKPVELVWSATSYTYNGNVQVPTASYTFNGVTVHASAYSGDTAVKNAGNNYSVTATALDNANFTLTGGKNLSRTFSIKARVIEISWNKITTTYYKGRSYTADVAISNRVGTDDVTLVYSTTLYGTAVSNTVTAVGNYSVEITGLSGSAMDNYTLTGASNLILTDAINIARQRVVVTWTGGGTVTYDGKDHTLTAVARGADDNSVVAISSYNGTLVYKNAGSYTASVSSLADNNYYFDSTTNSNTTVSLKINAAPVTVTWKRGAGADAATNMTNNSATVTYNGNAWFVYATIVGAVNNETVSFEYSPKNNYATDVGTYKFDISLLDDNYVFNGNTATLIVNPAPVTVTWKVNGNPVNGNSASVEYSGKGNTVEPVLTTEVYGKTVNYTFAEALGNAVNVGTYRTVISFDSNNFAASQSDRTFTLGITKAAIKVVWTYSGELVYNGENHEIKVTAQNGNGVAITGVFEDTSVMACVVGTYRATAAFADNKSGNYNIVEGSLNNTLVIRPRTVDLSWSNATVEYDGTAKSIRAQITNICSGDTVDLTYSVTMDGLNVDSAVNAGTYIFRVTNVSDSNYTLANVPASDLSKTLTITKKQIEIDNLGGLTFKPGISYEDVVAVLNRSLKIKDKGDADVSIVWVIRKDAAVYNQPTLVAGQYYVDINSIVGADAKNFDFSPISIRLNVSDDTLFGD